MPAFKLIATAYPNAASNTSITSAFAIPGDFSHYAIQVPASFAVTTTCGINLFVSDSATGTFSQVGYSNNPSTATTGFIPWGVGATAAVSGAIVIAEGFQFCPGYARLQFLQTCTANTSFKIYGRKFD